jgi:hypothetical protein
MFVKKCLSPPARIPFHPISSHLEIPMSANRSVDRFAVAHEKDRSAVAHENDRSSLCSFSFADGRRCRTPRCSSHPHFCYFHARKEAQALAAQQMGRDIASDLSGGYLSACDLSSALGRLFCAAAQGHIKPKTASTLAYLGQTLLQSIQLAQHEYINAFGTNSWRGTIRSSFAPPAPATEPDPKPDLLPSATPSSK